MTPETDLLTTNEIADALRVHRTTVLRWVATGRLHVIDLPGGRKRYRRSEVDRILAGRKSAA